MLDRANVTDNNRTANLMHHDRPVNNLLDDNRTVIDDMTFTDDDRLVIDGVIIIHDDTASKEKRNSAQGNP